MSPYQNVDILKLFHPKEVKMLVCLADLLVDLKIYSITAGNNIKQTTAILKRKRNRKSLNTHIKLSLKHKNFMKIGGYISVHNCVLDGISGQSKI